MVYDVNFSIEFNNVVNNINVIIREYRHLCPNNVKNHAEFAKFMNFLHDVNFKMEFVSDTEGYVRGKMLDALDYIKDNWKGYGKGTVTDKTINSIYDCISEFYFNN